MRYAYILLALSGLGWGQDGRNCHIERHIGSVNPPYFGDEWGWAEDLRIVCTPAPEPMDIPAIKVPVQQCVLPNSGMNVNSSFSCTMTAGSSCPCGHYETIQEDACPKGSGRVLLTDVDQGKHCVKFPK